MRRATTAVVLALFLLGCAPSGEPVQLLTGVDPDACYAGGETGMGGLLLADPDYGTSFNGMPVMWPTGFTAVRVGGKVVVLDGGAVVATTGRKYYISIAPVFETESRQRMETLNAFPAAAKCSYPWDFVDCGTPAPRSSPIDAAEPSCGYHAEGPTEPPYRPPVIVPEIPPNDPY